MKYPEHRHKSLELENIDGVHGLVAGGEMSISIIGIGVSFRGDENVLDYQDIVLMVEQHGEFIKYN